MSKKNLPVRILHASVGTPKWVPAPWMLALSRVSRAHPLMFLASLVALMVLTIGAYFSYQWYLLRPQPVVFDANITPPQIPALLTRNSGPQVLSIDFYVNEDSMNQQRRRAEKYPEYQAVIPTSILAIEHINSSELEGVSISPHVEGIWQSTEYGIRFEPEKHWPANTEYKVTFAPSLFAKSVLLDQPTYRFTTAPLAVRVTNSRLHADPNSPSKQRYVSTIESSHPISRASLEQKIKLNVQDSSLTVGYERLGFSLIEDESEGVANARRFHINSDNVNITDENRYLEMNLEQGLQILQTADYQKRGAGSPYPEEIVVKQKLQIPSASNFFRVVESGVRIVRDENDNPQQAFILELSGSVTPNSMVEHLEAYLLPKKDAARPNVKWSNANEVPPVIEAQAKRVKLTALPIENESSKVISFVFNAPENRQLMITLKSGFKSTGGFKFSKAFKQVVIIPEYPKELSFLGSGSVLDSGGDHKLGFVARGIKRLKVRVGKVRESHINHLISQTGGDFNSPIFNRSIGLDDIAKVSQTYLNLRQEANGKPTYASIDLSEHLNSADRNTGLFLVEAFGYDSKNRQRVQSRRLVLITNIGFLVKRNADKTQDVFVQNVRSGAPLANAKIRILGKNGLDVFSVNTDARGHAQLHDIYGLKQDKQPIAILVEKSGDLAYIPLDNHKREMNVSRFDTGGVYISPGAEKDIRAFSFTDRGIYRPGDTVKLAVIARSAELQPTKPFTIRMLITDPRGVTVYDKKHNLSGDSFFETEMPTQTHSATGIYRGEMRLLANGRYDRHLGTLEFSVEEFQPDRLKINNSIDKKILRARQDSNLAKNTIDGWLKPDELIFNVELNNLFGTPAQNRRLTADFRLSPSRYTFKKFPKYIFQDIVSTENIIANNQSNTLPDELSDSNGLSSFMPDLSHVAAGTYTLTFNSSGFEEGGGRSVQSRTTVRYSPRDYLLGFYADTDLNYVREKNEQEINILCVNRFATAQDCTNLTLQLVESTYVSTLVKQSNGTYQYQTIEKKSVVDKQSLSISADGYVHALNTDKPGTYTIQILDENMTPRQSIPFQVVGTNNISANLEEDSRLEVTLDKTEYRAGDWIEFQLKAPYTGSGLITIESTQTDAFTWFKTRNKQSVQRIQVPEGLRGNAYVQVSFIRSADSKEILTAPLSYAVAPFNIGKGDHTLALELGAPDNVQPGEKLKISVNADKPGRAIVYAVDEGILQVASYQTPDPLSFFLQKRALQVQTYQMFDLLQPEFDLLKELSATGGGMMNAKMASAPMASGNLNPFSRDRKEPVAFWSGILDVSPKGTDVEFDVPDHFDGALRIMVVAVSGARFSHAEQNVNVRGPFIVTANSPLVVAPGDTFSVTVGVSNQLENSGPEAEVSLMAKTSEHLEIIGKPTLQQVIGEGDEATLSYQLRALETLGSAELSFLASSESSPVKGSRIATATLSVRPASPRRTLIRSGRKGQEDAVVPLERELLEDLSYTTIAVSTNPTLLIDGLVKYLEVFPHACTEQIVSQASPILAYLNHPNYLGTPAQKQKNIAELLTSLRSRQLPNGAFSLWPGSSESAPTPSVHTMHALVDAAAQGIHIPSDMLSNGQQYLVQIGFDLQTMRSQPELAAYALYLLTRMGEQTNNGLIQLEEILNASGDNKPKKWKNQLLGAYMASSYRLLQRETEAVALIREYKFKNARQRINRYDSALYRDSMALYLMSKHFPEQLDNNDISRLEAVLEPILSGNINTMSSGRALIALKAYADTIVDESTALTVSSSSTKLNSKPESPVEWKHIELVSNGDEALYPTAVLSPADKAIRISSNSPVYYQTTQNGFDVSMPARALSEGLEIKKSVLKLNGDELNVPPKQGDDVLVKLIVRSAGNETHSDIAIVDLIPGGFEIDRESIRNGQSWRADYIDIREDRMVYYGSVGPRAIEIMYRARLTTMGEFAVPAAYASAMYDQAVHAHSAASSLSVFPR